MPPGFAEIETAAWQWRLSVFGAFQPDAEDAVPDYTGTLVLLGPREPGFWAAVTQSPEFADGAPDPLDRWSRRAVDALAHDLGAEPLFPFGGPPYRPFQKWAVRSGRAWVSPVGLLVHDTAGLWLSYRGALAFGERLELPATPACPCNSCAARPCLAACPVGALTAAGYDLPACHGFLDRPAGETCMTRGCAVRGACPVSQRYGRRDDQSAFHMRAFHR